MDIRNRHVKRLECIDRKSTRLNSSHTITSYAVFCLKKHTKQTVGEGWCVRDHSSDSNSLCRRVRRSRSPPATGWRRATSSKDSAVIRFFFNDTATTEIYTLSLHDALPIWSTIIITLDVIVIFAIVAHGSELKS